MITGYWLRLSAVICIAIVLLATDIRAQEKSKSNEADAPREYGLDWALKNDTDRFMNGVMLRIDKAEVVAKDKTNLLRINWSLQYNGKRPPLIILRPSLEDGTYGQTDLIVIARGKSGEAYAWHKYSPPKTDAFGFGPSHAEKEWFLTIEKGKAAEGVIELNMDEPKKRFLKYFPKEFAADVLAELYVTIYHHPRDRGDESDLDAWTGTTYSPPKKVVKPKW